MRLYCSDKLMGVLNNKKSFSGRVIFLYLYTKATFFAKKLVIYLCSYHMHSNQRVNSQALKNDDSTRG